MMHVFQSAEDDGHAFARLLLVVVRLLHDAVKQFSTGQELNNNDVGELLIIPLYYQSVWNYYLINYQHELFSEEVDQSHDVGVPQPPQDADFGAQI
jgi:hypothetical protein